MRICLFTPNFPPQVGGTETVSVALADQFHRQGNHVVVLAYAKHPVDDFGWPYEVVRYHKTWPPRWRPERIGRHLNRLHRVHHFDVFLANYGVPCGYAAIRVGRRYRVPTVLVSHGGDLHRSSRDRGRPHIWHRTCLAYQQADGLIAISTYLEKLIREINPHPKRLVNIPNGIDIDDLNRPASRPDDFPNPHPFILFLGNLRPVKGVDDVLDAFAQVDFLDRPIHLVFVGDGKLRPTLEQRVFEMSLSDRVHFVGQRFGEDKRWFLQNCKYGLMPSLEEGHPLVAMEFLAVGKPVICSNSPAFDGMLEDWLDALRVPPRRSEFLAESIRRLERLDTAALNERFRVRVQDSDWAAIAQRYLAFMDRVIAETRGA